MAYEQKEGDISLFKNKNAVNNQPSMRGTMVWNGQKIKISLWTKGEGENKFMAGKAELDSYVRPQSAPAPVQQVEVSQPETDEELPF